MLEVRLQGFWREEAQVDALTVISWATRDKNSLPTAWWLEFINYSTQSSQDYCLFTEGQRSQGTRQVIVQTLPAWDTDNPANSINWSMEKAPVLMSSWSRAAALFAEIVFRHW